MRAPTHLACATLVLILSGCGQPTAGGPAPTIPEVLESLLNTQESLPFSGVRRVEAHYEWEGSLFDLDYTEQVQSDGAGNFSIVPLEVSSSLTLDPFVFKQIQQSRAGFFHRYRDFSVRDWSLFVSNWSLTDQGEKVSVAGRSAWSVGISRKSGMKTRYQVAFDLATGLVLRYEELGPDGALLSRMEFQSVDMTPDLSGAIWHGQSNSEQVLDLQANVVDQLGFQPVMPKLPPAGYQFHEASSVVDPDGRRWLKVTYCDGVESLFFLHGDPLGGPSAQGGPVNAGASVGEQDGLRDEALYFRAGPLTVVEGRIHELDLIAVGKVEPYDLLLFIESSLP